MEASMTLREKLKELIRDRLIYASGIRTGDLFDHTAELTVENIISLLAPIELEYKKALEADAADLWRVTNAIKKEIREREWIMEGRGCYAWDDDRYRDETRLAFEAITKLISDVQHPAQLRFHELQKGLLK